MLNTALGILAGLLWLAKKYFNKKELERAQAEADKVQDNPTDWFRDHFRVPADTNDGSKTETNDTKVGKGDGS